MNNLIKGLDVFKYGSYILTDKDRKPIKHIIKDLKALKKEENRIRDLGYYFTSLMYKKDVGSINKYASGRELNQLKNLQKRNNGVKQDWRLIDDKIKFAEHMKNAEVPIPLMIGKIVSGKMKVEANNEQKSIENKNEIKVTLQILLKKHKVLFLKKNISSGGKAVYRLKKNKKIDFSFLEENQDYLIQKRLRQHKELNEMNPSCINTLRLVTLNKGGETSVLYSRLRLGIGNSHVDNASSGGIFCNYNIHKNKLGSKSYQYIHSGGRSFTKHPQTQCNFEEKSLPYPEKIISQVKKAANVYPKRKIIGWDIAYTPAGPKIIEANTNLNVIGTQISLKGLKNNPEYKKLIEEL